MDCRTWDVQSRSTRTRGCGFPSLLYCIARRGQPGCRMERALSCRCIRFGYRSRVLCGVDPSACPGAVLRQSRVSIPASARPVSFCIRSTLLGFCITTDGDPVSGYVEVETFWYCLFRFDRGIALIQARASLCLCRLVFFAIFRCADASRPVRSMCFVNIRSDACHSPLRKRRNRER